MMQITIHKSADMPPEDPRFDKTAEVLALIIIGIAVLALIKYLLFSN